MSPFRYTPLKDPEFDLRLITFGFGLDHENLSCSLSTFNNQSVPFSYQALSYTWGDATRKVPISLDGKEFLVTPNLEAALRNLRETLNSWAWLWIDAICINQDDSDERDQQVRRMKSIYQQAERVIIWLGDFNEPCDDPLRLDLSKWKIDRVEPNSRNDGPLRSGTGSFLGQEASRKQGTEVSIGLEDCNHLHNPQIWVQLSRLFNRPWFERLWVIQELAVSRKAVIFWGKLQLAWSTLEKAAKFILRPGEVLLPPQIRKIFPLLGAHRITQVDLQSMFNVNTENILTVLHNTQNAKCSDPRDRLFAISGVIDDAEDIEIDYSIPVGQVYRKWAQRRINRLKILDVLSACADSGRSGDLPSWVPDLRRPFGQDKVLWIFSQATVREEWVTISRIPFMEDTYGCRSLWFSPDGGKLFIEGSFLGVISSLSSIADAVTNLQDPTDLTARLRDIVADWEYIFTAQIETKNHEARFKAAILRDFSPIESIGRDLKEAYDIWRGFKDEPHVIWDREAVMKNIERTLFPRLHGSQIFITEQDIGVVAGNCNTRIGDELWILIGGLTPFILRRLSPTEHRLITPCYLHEFMDVIRGYWPRNIVWQETWQRLTLV